MEKLILIIIVLSLYFPLSAFPASSNENSIILQDNTESIEILEEQILLLEEQLDTQLKISGYADVEYTNSSDPAVEPGFRLHHFSLFFKKKINEKWRFFSEIEYEDGPEIEFPKPPVTPGAPSDCNDCSGKIFVEAINVDFLWKPQASFRFGRFFTPAGIWSIDHYPPFVPTQERPLHIRKLFPQLVDGTSFFGRIPFSSSSLTYDLYIGNGEENSGSGDLNSDKAGGLKINLQFPTLEHTEVGATIYRDVLNDDTDKDVLGFHTKIVGGGVTFQAEYAHGTYTPVTGQEYRSKGHYGQLYYRLSNWLFGYRYDFFDQVTTSNQAQTRQSVFFNYRVDKDIVVKLEFHDTETDGSAENVELTIISIAIYLGD